MNYFWTLLNGAKRILHQHVGLVAGVTAQEAGTPKVVLVDAEGRLIVNSAEGFALPVFDYLQVSYVGATNNVATVVYKTGGASGTTVATLTLSYVGGVPATDNAKVASVTRS